MSHHSLGRLHSWYLKPCLCAFKVWSVFTFHPRNEMMPTLWGPERWDGHMDITWEHPRAAAWVRLKSTDLGGILLFPWADPLSLLSFPSFELKLIIFVAQKYCKEYRHTLFYYTFQILLFFFWQIESLWQLSVNQVCAVFPAAFAHFLCPCYISAIMAIFQAFSLLLNLFWSPVISDLWCDCFDWLKAQMMVSVF